MATCTLCSHKATICAPKVDEQYFWVCKFDGAADVCIRCTPFDTRYVTPWVHNVTMSADGITISRIMLGRHISKYRKRAGKTPADFDGSNGSRKTMSKSKLYQLERGALKDIKWQDILAICVICEVASEEQSHLLDLAERAAQPGMWEEFNINDKFAAFLEMESVATHIQAYENEVVNGLFQTERYLAALRKVHHEPDRGLRLKRQERFFARNALPKIELILNESVLARKVGGAQVMEEQLRHLAALDKYPGLSIRVLPFDVGSHPLMHGPFIIMGFGDNRVFPDTVYVEGLDGSRYHERADILARYRANFEETQPSTIPVKEFLDDYKMA